MTDDSYHLPICIGIGKIFSSVLGIESIGKSGIDPPLLSTLLASTQHNWFGGVFTHKFVDI